MGHQLYQHSFPCECFFGRKHPKKSAIIDHILLEGHNATYDDFSILTTESNEFKLHLKESLLIKRDKPELNRNCYTHPLELFD